jgi:predicted aspartyl protease
MRLPIVALIFMLAGTGCQTIAPPPQTIAPPVPTLPPLPIQSTAIATSPLYQTAIATAQTATQLSQQAKSVEDWQAVVIQWQTAVNLMQKIPEHDVNRTAALKDLVLLEEGVARSKAKLKEFQVQSSDQENLTPTQRIVPAQPSSKPIEMVGVNYQATIKSYRNNIPIIDVMFNGSVSFEMMVDTGASNTMITESMSKILQVKAVRSVPAQTPGGEVEFQVGYVDSIGIGDNSVEGLPVAIGTEALLGHDFFGDCNINIKRDQNIVEFSQCKSDQTKKR